MKTLIAALLLCASTLLGADFTNGVFYVDKPVECHLIAQNGATTTNTIAAGETRQVGLQLVELCPAEPTTIYLSGGLKVNAEAKAVLSINVFDQEVKNLTASPRPAVFGSHNISLLFSSGKFTVSYPSQDAGSSCAISTPLAMYQMNPGKFIFQVSEGKSLVYVLDGMMIVHGDKNRTDTAKKGSKTTTGQIDTETATTTRPINQAESNSIAAVQATALAIQFIVIDGRVRGVQLAP